MDHIFLQHASSRRTRTLEWWQLSSQLVRQRPGLADDLLAPRIHNWSAFALTAKPWNSPPTHLLVKHRRLTKLNTASIHGNVSGLCQTASDWPMSNQWKNLKDSTHVGRGIHRRCRQWLLPVVFDRVMLMSWQEKWHQWKFILAHSRQCTETRAQTTGVPTTVLAFSFWCRNPCGSSKVSGTTLFAALVVTKLYNSLKSAHSSFCGIPRMRWVVVLQRDRKLFVGDSNRTKKSRKRENASWHGRLPGCSAQ